MELKKIGIILRNFEEGNKSFLGTRGDLFKALEKFDVNLIGIPITNDFEKIKDTLCLCDGIIMSGGDTILENDLRLVEYLYENDIPTLGICLGMQVMGKYFGGVEIKVENHYSTDNDAHNILINRETLLFRILGKDEIMVNSRHKEAIVNTNLKVNAKSEDNIIEGIEDSSKRFFLGVEWHPESLDNEDSHNLFKSFIEKINEGN